MRTLNKVFSAGLLLLGLGIKVDVVSQARERKVRSLCVSFAV